tara:strand:+ start:4665 stop:5105 length:441 start_codon:yes stop_codon:yes gene_type:complete
MAKKFNVRVKDRERIEERVKESVRNHFLKLIESDKLVINKLRDLNLRKDKIKQQRDKLYDLDEAINDDAQEFADWLKSCDHYGEGFSVEGRGRYSSSDKIHVAWNNYKLWSLVHDSTMFNAEDNPAVTSLGMLEEIVLQDVIEKLS